MRRGSSHPPSAIGAAALLIATTAAALAGGVVSPAAAAPVGANGGCASSSFTIPHPSSSSESITIFEPQGGNDCGGRRPVVLFAHGYTARTPLAYIALINHLVSRGFVVIYPTYPNAGTPSLWTQMEDAGFIAGTAASGRTDLTRIGIVGHSMGAGMTARLAQLANQHGWGANGFFVAPMAPFAAWDVGNGPIAVPPNVRWLTIAFESDQTLDNGIATETYRALALPNEQRTFLTVLDDPAHGLMTGHNVPVGGQTDDMDIYGVWRPIDATADCAMSGNNCDFAYADAQVGATQHPANIVSDQPIDANLPLPNQIPKTECTSPLVPRGCPAQPWMTTLRDQTTGVGGTTAPQTITFGDQQTGTTGATVTTSSSDPEILPPANVVAAPAGNGMLSITAHGAPGRAGRAIASVTITDPNGNAGTRSFVATFGDGSALAGGFHPTAPTRVLDTRVPIGTTGGRLGEGGAIELQVAGVAGVPAAGAAGVVLNVTAQNPSATSFVTAWPTGDPRQVTSNLNTTPGQTRPNLVVARVGPSGKVSLFNNSGSVNLIADLAGWIDDGRASTATGRSRYVPQSPSRVLDTRSPPPPKPFGAGEVRDLDVATPCAGAGGTLTAVAMNVTAVSPTAASHVTVWPSGVPVPNASNLNFGAGETVPNLVMVAVGANGKVSFRNNSGTVHLLADLAGCYVQDVGSPNGKVVVASPARLADTRFGIGTTALALGTGETRTIQVTGHAGVPPSAVQAVIINLTGTEPTATTHLTAWPAGQSQPIASNVNLLPGQTAPNLAVVKLSATGAVSVYNNSGSTQVIVDVEGWIT